MSYSDRVNDQRLEWGLNVGGESWLWLKQHGQQLWVVIEHSKGDGASIEITGKLDKLFSVIQDVYMKRGR